MFSGGGGDTEAPSASRELSGSIGRPTMTERLKSQRDALRRRLTDVEAAIEAIEASPQVQKAVDALSKLNM